MNRKQKGFTVLELIIVILLLTILVAVIFPAIIRTTDKIMARSRATADLANMRNSLLAIQQDLLIGEGMSDISVALAPVESQLNPDAELLINYSKPVTLDLYFVDGDVYYSLDYLLEVASNGYSNLSTKKPFTLGFWYRPGEGKINEYEKSK